MHMRILLCDDHQIVLDSLSLLIASMEGCEVVGALSDARKVSGFLEVNTVDVLLADVTMPFLTGIDLVLQLRGGFPSLPVLMLTVSDDPDTIRRAFQAGAAGYVLKTAGRSELERAIGTVARGDRYFSDPVLNRLIYREEPGEAPAELPQQVTPRELEVIRLIAQELSTSEIAERLFLSTGTVETHRHNILRKLGVKNSIGIIKYAMQHKLV